MEHATTLRARVYRFIRAIGEQGVTDEELIRASKMAANTIRPRRIELTQFMPPLVVDSGKTRPTRSGRQATVWTAAKL